MARTYFKAEKANYQLTNLIHLVYGRYTSCDLTYRFPIRVHFTHARLDTRAYITLVVFCVTLLMFAIYFWVHWRDRCRRKREAKAKRREEERDSSDLSEEWAELEKMLCDPRDFEDSSENDGDRESDAADLTHKNK